MTRGSKIPAEVQWIVIRLSSLLKKEDISVYTGISVRSVERILLYFHAHGTIQSRESEQGRKKHLRDLDVEVSLIILCT
jgi:transcription initiation factor IIE alpha subunit